MGSFHHLQLIHLCYALRSQQAASAFKQPEMLVLPSGRFSQLGVGSVPRSNQGLRGKWDYRQQEERISI